MTGHINTGAFFTTKHCGVTVSPNLGQQQNESGDKNRSVKNPDKHPHGVNVVHYAVPCSYSSIKAVWRICFLLHSLIKFSSSGLDMRYF